MQVKLCEEFLGEGRKVPDSAGGNEASLVRQRLSLGYSNFKQSRWHYGHLYFPIQIRLGVAFAAPLKR